VRRAPVLLSLVVLALVAGCGEDADEGGGGDDAGGAATPRTVTLLAYDSFVTSDGIFDAFTEQTGITVEVATGGDAGELLSKAILTKGNPEGDVLWGVDNTLLSRAIEEDIYEPYTSGALGDVPDELRALVPGGEATPVDYGDVCLNVDQRWFDEHALTPPASLEDLTDPAYRDLLVVPNPATSSPGLAFLLASVAEFGEDGWQIWWARLRDNGVEVVDGWTEAYTVRFSGSSGAGPKPIVVSYGSSPPAEVVFADPPIDAPPTAVVEASCFRQVEFAGILRGSDAVDASQKLIDFLLSPAFQEDLPLNLFVYPANERAALPDVFTEFAVRPDQPRTLDPGTIAEHRAEWVDEWTNIVLR
jgi:thiamine transport system substrate-binding protein